MHCLELDISCLETALITALQLQIKYSSLILILQLLFKARNVQYDIGSHLIYRYKIDLFLYTKSNTVFDLESLYCSKIFDVFKKWLG